MRFLVDAQLPTALDRWIESQGQTPQHVADLSDEAIEFARTCQSGPAGRKEGGDEGSGGGTSQSTR